LDFPSVSGGVHVEGQDGDAGKPGVGDDHALGVHAGVVGEDAGVEGGGMVALEPG
jgi:hypothetical protein